MHQYICKLTLLYLFLCMSANAHTVRVKILSKYHPSSTSLQFYECNKHKVDLQKITSFHSKSCLHRLVVGDTIRFYEGEIYITKLKNELVVINKVDLEKYLSSVVIGEMGIQSLEAMKAQSIISRTWALKNIHSENPYDFVDLTIAQVYPGHSKYSEKVYEQLKDFPPLVVTYDKKLVEIYFHARCANTIYSPYEIWGKKKVPYLKNFILNGLKKEKSWSRSYSFLQLSKIFSINLDKFSKIQKYQRKDGRIELELNSLRMAIDNFRLKINRALGWNEIRSNDFKIQMNDSGVVITGYGLGHLVGVCQEAVKQMADDGMKASDIIHTFYHGIALVKFN